MGTTMQGSETLDIRIIAIFIIFAASILGAAPPLYIKVRGETTWEHPATCLARGGSMKLAVGCHRKYMNETQGRWVRTCTPYCNSASLLVTAAYLLCKQCGLPLFEYVR